jgi:ribosomal protein S18 acetylase RimI-like enzyme
LAAVVDLQSALHVAFAGIESRRLYHAICRDALREGGRAVCLVCEIDGIAAGFVVAFVHATAYWKEFCVRRPALALRILASRLWRKRDHTGAAGTAASPVPALVDPGPAPASWAESTDRIAKIQFIGVAPLFRGRGIASELYRRLAIHLGARGLTRIDARIATDNIASIKLHHNAGWKLYLDSDGIFAIYPLTRPD